jgi:type I restriction enzyme S subunit
MEEWKEVRLGEVCNLIAGFAFKANDFGNHSSKVIKIGDINPPYVNFATMIGVDMSNYDREKLQRYEVCYDDFVLAMTGATIGKVGRYIEKTPAYLNQRVLLFRPFAAQNKYIYHLVCSESFHKYVINHIDSESAQPNISAATIGKYEFYLPPLLVQERIANILSSLDDKIELNRRINDNLEQQAQALFKSWFVDFEPWGGKMPDDWKEGTVSNLVDLLNGYAFKSSDFIENGKYYLITIKGVQDGRMIIEGADRLDVLPDKMPQWCLLQRGDILLSLTGNVGRCCIVDADQCLLNQRVAKIRPKNDYNKLFAYVLFRQNEMKAQMISISRGTAQMNLSPIETGNLTITIPSDEVLKDFGGRYNHIIDIILNKREESRRLAQLRDTLLPKLMSGELKIS